MHTVDTVIVGAGAAGLFAAARIGQTGRPVLLLDHATRLGERIRISGGGRCNFTNLGASPHQYLSQNPDFCRSALAYFTPTDFLALLQKHHITWHEKHKGQLFCDRSAQAIVQMLLKECEAGAVECWHPCQVDSLQPTTDSLFTLSTSRGTIRCQHVVIATGGLAAPKIGASDWGLRTAQQFGHILVTPRPALVPLTFNPINWKAFSDLAGIALEVDIQIQPQLSILPTLGKASKKRATQHIVRFTDDMLFTHRGLSGPAILQISSFWQAGDNITINLLPQQALATYLQTAKQHSKRHLSNLLSELLPQRLVRTFIEQYALVEAKPLPECRNQDLEQAAQSFQQWPVTPLDHEGWNKAEVMAGGVDTRDLSSRTMESTHLPGLFFIGEVVDVTGWLGGYNFQWAWSSAAACAKAINERPKLSTA